jgi:hypothetical protein
MKLGWITCVGKGDGCPGMSREEWSFVTSTDVEGDVRRLKLRCVGWWEGGGGMESRDLDFYRG